MCCALIGNLFILLGTTLTSKHIASEFSSFNINCSVLGLYSRNRGFSVPKVTMASYSGGLKQRLRSLESFSVTCSLAASIIRTVSEVFPEVFFTVDKAICIRTWLLDASIMFSSVLASVLPMFWASGSGWSNSLEQKLRWWLSLPQWAHCWFRLQSFCVCPLCIGT